MSENFTLIAFKMKNLTALLIMLGVLCFCSSQLAAQCCANGEKANCCSGEGWSSARPDGNAPIGIMGDHYHGAGSLMFSYRYMYMNMEGNRAGSVKVSDSHIFQNNYMMAPQNMDMQMHMFGAMYGMRSILVVSRSTDLLA